MEEAAPEHYRVREVSCNRILAGGAPSVELVRRTSRVVSWFLG